MQDQGPGLTESDQARLYQKFSKLSARPTGGESSSGLGLSIVVAIAKEHDAALSVHPGNHGGLSIEVTFAAPATRHDHPSRNSLHSLVRRKRG